MDLLDSILKLQEKYDDDTPGMARGGRIGFRNRGAVITEDMQKKSAEAIKLKTTTKLKNFVEKFKLENNGQLPTQKEIMDSVGGKSSSIQKYLKEGVDYATRTTKKEAGRLAGLRSGEVRAVPEGKDPSYVKRAKTLEEANKFLSKQDADDFKKINDGKKAINKYFKSKPELINTTEFGKNIKALLSLRMDKDTGNIFSKVRPDDYYIKRAKEGKLFDIFDIKAVKEGGRSLRFPTNINITPGQFNQVFLQNQVGKFFAKGINEDALKNVENILKERNIRVKLPNVGYLGQDNPVAVDRAKGTFPKILDTLKTMKAPKEILQNFIDITPSVGPLKIFKPLKKFEDGGRVPFRVGTAAKKIAMGALTPSGVATLLTPDLDLTKAENRISLASEAAFAPELVKASIGATKGMKNRKKQKLIQQLLNLLAPTRKALRIARVASPIGIASLVGEGAYQAGKFAKKRIGELKAMSPEERQELRRKGDEFAFSEFAAAGGGIAKEAGDPSGAMLESMNPDSQGLQGLMKRVRNR